MNFGQALETLKAGETKIRRKAWASIYYCYIDNRNRNKIVLVLDKDYLHDEDLLAEDWELYQQ